MQRSMRFNKSSLFKKNFNKLPKKIQDKFDERMFIFIEDAFNPILRNHKLHGEYEEYRSINITSDIRVIYKKISDINYYLYDIGTHSGLYE